MYLVSDDHLAAEVLRLVTDAENGSMLDAAPRQLVEEHGKESLVGHNLVRVKISSLLIPKAAAHDCGFVHCQALLQHLQYAGCLAQKIAAAFCRGQTHNFVQLTSQVNPH